MLQIDKHKFDDLSPSAVGIAAYLMLLRQRNHSLADDLRDCQRNLEGAKTEINTHKCDKILLSDDTTRAMFDDFRRDAERGGAQVAKLRADLLAVQGMNANLAVENDWLNTQLTAFGQREPIKDAAITTLHAKIAELTAALAEMTQDRNAHNDRNIDRMVELTKLTADLAEAESGRDDLRRDFDSMRAARQATMDELATAKGALVTAQLGYISNKYMWFIAGENRPVSKEVSEFLEENRLEIQRLTAELATQKSLHADNLAMLQGLKDAISSDTDLHEIVRGLRRELAALKSQPQDARIVELSEQTLDLKGDLNSAQRQIRNLSVELATATAIRSAREAANGAEFDDFVATISALNHALLAERAGE